MSRERRFFRADLVHDDESNAPPIHPSVDSAFSEMADRLYRIESWLESPRPTNTVTGDHPHSGRVTAVQGCHCKYCQSHRLGQPVRDCEAHRPHQDRIMPVYRCLCRHCVGRRNIKPSDPDGSAIAALKSELDKLKIRVGTAESGLKSQAHEIGRLDTRTSMQGDRPEDDAERLQRWRESLPHNRVAPRPRRDTDARKTAPDPWSPPRVLAVLGAYIATIWAAVALPTMMTGQPSTLAESTEPTNRAFAVGEYKDVVDGGIVVGPVWKAEGESAPEPKEDRK